MESNLEQLCGWVLKLAAPSATWEREYRFYRKRLWRADFCCLEHKIIVEAEGGVWTHGRHTTGSGFTSDLAKYNQATVMGYRVFRFDRKMLENGEALNTIQEAIKGENNTGANKGKAQTPTRRKPTKGTSSAGSPSG